jgi:hypothetical protein
VAVGLNRRPKEWSRPPEPHPPDAGCWCSRDKRRPYVSLIWCSTQSGHGNGLRPWIRNNNRRTAHELLNLTLDLDHAHVSWHRSCLRLDRRIRPEADLPSTVWRLDLCYSGADRRSRCGQLQVAATRCKDVMISCVRLCSRSRLLFRNNGEFVLLGLDVIFERSLSRWTAMRIIL